MGAVHLSVADLDRSIDYYESAIGLRVHARDGDRAALGTGGEDLLVLTERPGARPADGYCGLFHFALLVPERADLARWLDARRERAGAAHRACPTTSSARRSTCAIPTGTGSRSTGTARARSGRGRSRSA